jgi:anti-sigma factor RsiW
MSDCSGAHRCDRCYGALSDYLDGRLPASERQVLEEHLRRCPPCLIYLEQFRMVHEATGSVRAEQLPADFDQVMSGVLAAWQAKCSENERRPA